MREAFNSEKEETTITHRYKKFLFSKPEDLSKYIENEGAETNPFKTLFKNLFLAKKNTFDQSRDYNFCKPVSDEAEKLLKNIIFLMKDVLLKTLLRKRVAYFLLSTPSIIYGSKKALKQYITTSKLC